MSKTVKILLAVVGCFMLACALAIGFGARWLKHAGSDLMTEGNHAMTEGRAFGSGQPADACEAEALRRSANCGGVLCEAMAKVFLTACLPASQVPPTYCMNVPPTFQIMDSVNFQRARCTAAGHPNDPRCGRLLQGVQEYCQRGAYAVPPTTPAPPATP